MALGLASRSFPRVGHGSYPGCVSQDSWGVNDRKPPQTEINQRGDVKRESLSPSPERADGRLDAGMLGVRTKTWQSSFKARSHQEAGIVGAPSPLNPFGKSQESSLIGQSRPCVSTNHCGRGWAIGMGGSYQSAIFRGWGGGEQFPKGRAGKCFWKRRC